MLRFVYRSFAIRKTAFPEWELFQLLKQIQLSITNASIRKSRYVEEWCLPESFADNKDATYNECNAFIKALDAFYSHVFTEKERILSLKDEREVTKEVEKLSRVVIVAKEGNIISSSLDEKLNFVIKEAIKETKFVLRTDLHVFSEEEVYYK